MALKSLVHKAMAEAENLKLNLNVDESKDLSGLIRTLANWVGIIAGIIAFFYLVYSGILYLTAGGNADQAKKGQQGIIYALIGLIIIALAYGIVTAIITTLNDGEEAILPLIRTFV